MVTREFGMSIMLLLVILVAVLAIGAAAIVLARNRWLRPRGRPRSRYFSISLADPDAPALPEDRPH